MKDLREQLRDCLCGRVCFMGLGNPDYGDDGFGVRLAEELLAAGVPDVVIAGTVPDRYVGRVSGEGFSHLVFLDAVEFGGVPGSVVFLNSEEMAARFPQISTHKISLSVLSRWAEASGTTKAWLVGMQPESLQSGQPLSAVVRETLAVLKELLTEVSCGEREEREKKLAEVNVC